MGHTPRAVPTGHAFKRVAAELDLPSVDHPVIEVVLGDHGVYRGGGRRLLALGRFGAGDDDRS
jgi:hypothetical protein